MNKLKINLQYQLKINKISQTSLAKIIGVNQNTISRWCNGEREPSLDMVIKVCKVLNTDPNELLGWEEDCLYSFEYNHNDTRLVHKEKK